MRTKLKQKGLTLTELLVALSIMALGMAVVVPSYKRSRVRANKHSIKMTAEGVRDTTQNCIQRAGLWAKTEQRRIAQCDTLQKLGVQGYCPICFTPRSNGSVRYGTRICVDMKQKGHNGCVSCEGRSCTSCVDPKDPKLEAGCPSGCPPDKGFKCQHSGSCGCA